MRYVVYGAGAVGGAIAACLTDADRDVVMVGRGQHADLLQRRGLTLKQPSGTRRVAVRVQREDELQLTAGDVVIVAVKSQDARAVFDSIETLCTEVTVVTTQNGVENERWAAGRFAHLVGAMVWVPAVFLVPGEIAVYADEPMGAMRLGAWPNGESAVAAELASAVANHGFDCDAVPNVQAWKYAKLLQNLGNAIDSYLIRDPATRDLRRKAADEGARVLDAAGLPYIPLERLNAEMNRRVATEPIDGASRPGGSTWQSVSRGKPSEIEFINGPICRLGSEHGIATPINDALVALDRERPAPRSVSIAAFDARLDNA